MTCKFSDITFDNLFTLLNFVNHLSEQSIGGIGTLRANRTDRFPIKDKTVIGKEPRGTFDY